ncbi:MAG: hypothetical protein UY16_C0063G0004 [Candidatus Gottesmanbacteria bacterium GW2011_GWA2_47_9]|uniref:Uncharacterized protein n=1 Tax=Candidatus Gottesmanbacteria bacterium GW2011_GWA2_47_9 TaxID=1618445 RepID=A0A0G1TW38_9BACT|nr:MAG: hypothetical protein UY16_C0063G0004 [Candidatus Gottesmanbacteria bacterium GW2011_GWA2_47_9]
MKATKAGPTIGKAMEDFDGTSTIVALGTEDAKVILEGSANATETDRIPSETEGDSIAALQNDSFADLNRGIGVIMAFINTSYSGGELTMEGWLDDSHQKTASDEAVIGDLAKLGGTPNLRTDSLISQFLDLVKRGVDPTGIEPVRPEFLGPAPKPGGPTPTTIIASASAWVQEHWESLGKFNTDLVRQGPTLSVDVLSPIATDSAGLAVRLGDGQTFGIYNKEASPSALFDAFGNATLSGELTASTVQATQASISGTLYADRIVTRFGEVADATSLRDLDERLASASSVLAQFIARPEERELKFATTETTPDATSSALLALLEADASHLEGESNFLHLPGEENADTLTLKSNVAILGATTLGQTTIAGGLMVDGAIQISSLGGIETFSGRPRKSGDA